MRIVEKLLYGIGGLLALVLLFILLCHFKPELAENLGETLKANAKESEQQITEETTTLVESTSPKDQLDEFDTATASDGTVVMPIAAKEYIAPAENELIFPDWAKSKSGLEPIEAEGTQITEEEATEAFDELGVGNAGKGLDFGSEMYPYYHMLDTTGKAMYRQIYANANSLIKDFAPIEAISAKLLENAFIAVVNDHPELFWVNTAYEYQYAPTGQVASIFLSFNKTADRIDEAKQLFEESAVNILQGADELENDYEKELYVHDRLISRVSYSKAASMNQSAYSALVGGKTVCAGYARAYQYLMQKLGIPCYYCTGFAGENHAWNIIKLKDDYYNVDATWADTNPGNYLYFNGSDADYVKYHIRRSLSVNLPPCNGELYRLLEVELEEEDEPEEEESKEIITTNTPTQEESTSVEETVVVVRTLEQVGFKYEDLIRTIEDYYADCSMHLVDTNAKTVTFQNVVIDSKLWKQIMKGYEKGDYESAYMNRVLVEKHLDGAKATITGEELADGSFLITHKIILQ